MNTANEISKYIIFEFKEAGECISNIKLQKILYYVQGWHLGIYGKEIFPEDFQAWVKGPVIYSIYKEYNTYYPTAKETEKPDISKSLKKHIYEVLECYGGETPYSLVNLTHKEWPWIEAREGIPQDVLSSNIISKNTMKDFFAKKAKDHEETGNYIPNLETITAIEESKRGVGVKEFNSLEDLFNDLSKDLKQDGIEITCNV